MGVLKSIVILGAVGLVVGFTLLFQQIQERRAERRQEAEVTQEGVVAVPPGQRVVSVTPSGSGLALLAEGNGVQTLLLLDRHGHLQHQVELRPAPVSAPATP